jgi:hypothetical protein
MPNARIRRLTPAPAPTPASVLLLWLSLPPCVMALCLAATPAHAQSPRFTVVLDADESRSIADTAAYGVIMHMEFDYRVAYGSEARDRSTGRFLIGIGVPIGSR